MLQNDIFRDINEMDLLSFQCLTETSCATADYCFVYVFYFKKIFPKYFTNASRCLMMRYGKISMPKLKKEII